MAATKEQIEHTIKQLPTLDDETLVYYYKCSLGRDATYKPLIKAIDSVRRSRNKHKILPEEEVTNVSTDES